MPYNFVAAVFTQRNFVADFLQALLPKSAFLRFSDPLWGTQGQRTTIILGMIEKRVVDFLLALIELFCQVLPLRSYERLLVENRRFRYNGGRLTQNFRQKGSLPTNHSSQKTRLNDLSCGIQICTDLSTVLSQFTRVTDGRTDRILIAIPRLHSMQRGKKTTWWRRSWGRDVLGSRPPLSGSVAVQRSAGLFAVMGINYSRKIV